MKSKSTAMWLAFLTGSVGGHKFYLGDSKAWVYLLFFWTYIPALFGVFEGISLMRMSENEFNDKYNSMERQHSSVNSIEPDSPLRRSVIIGGVLSVLVFLGVAIFTVPRTDTAGVQHQTSGASPATSTGAEGTWMPGTTRQEGHCYFKLVRAGLLRDPEDIGKKRGGVVFEISADDELKHSCSFNLHIKTKESNRELKSDITVAPSVEKGAPVCFSNQILYDFKGDTELVVDLRDGGASDEGLLKGMVRNGLAHKNRDIVVGSVQTIAREEEWNNAATGFAYGSSCAPAPAKTAAAAATAEPPEDSPQGKAWRRLAEASLPGETPYDQLERWCKANIKPKFPNFRDFDLCTPDMPWWSAPQDFQTPGSNSLEVRDNENKRADIAAAWAQAPIVLLTENHGASRRSKGYNEKTSTFSLTLYGPGFGDALSFKPISVKGSGISIGKYSAIDYMNPFEVHVPCNEDVARKLYKVLDVDASCEHDDHGCGTSDVVWKVIGKVESIGFLGKDCSQGMYGDCLKTFGPVIKPLGVRVSLEGGGKEVFLEKDSVQDISPGTVLFQWISPDAPL